MKISNSLASAPTIWITTKTELSTLFAKKPLLKKAATALVRSNFGKNEGKIWPLDPSGKNFLVLISAEQATMPLAWKKAAAESIQFAQSIKVPELNLGFAKANRALDLAWGAGLGEYQFALGEKEKQQVAIKNLGLTCAAPLKIDWKDLSSQIESVSFSRWLVDLPNNYLHPRDLVEQAKKIAKSGGSKFRLKVYEKKDLEKIKAGGLLAVGAGSNHPPAMIVLEYRGGPKNQAPIALVGKGVCFDTGGYNLKPTNYIEDMSLDMGGAATVLGAMKFLSMTKPAKNVVAVIGAVENMIDANAYRPGDIITMMNGKTVQIENTDAEGRVVLADCLHWAEREFAPESMATFATLTGAVMVALGDKITGAMTQSESLWSRFAKLAETTDEQIWRLPLFDEHIKNCDHPKADLENIKRGHRLLGSTMGAAFLSHFVEKTPWIHFDMGGSAWRERSDGLRRAGATGDLVRLVIKWATS